MASERVDHAVDRRVGEARSAGQHEPAPKSLLGNGPTDVLVFRERRLKVQRFPDVPRLDALGIHLCHEVCDVNGGIFNGDGGQPVIVLGVPPGSPRAKKRKGRSARAAAYLSLMARRRSIMVSRRVS